MTRSRVGIGGWNIEPWRDTFDPKGWPQARELSCASRQRTAIEIDSACYSSPMPASSAKWHDETSGGCVCSTSRPV
jgi:uncharacterized protein YecE (DUF72 family)